MVSRYKVWGLWLIVVSGVSLISFGLRLSQIEFDFGLPTGTAQTGTFLVINDESEPTTVNVTLADWDRLPDGENRFIEPGSVARSAANWVTFAPAQFTLAPDESVEVRFTLTVPTDITGTFWTALLVEGSPRQVETPGGTTVLVRRRFAVKILETPPGSGPLEGRITDIQIGGQNPLTTVVQFENTGLVNMPGVKGRVEVRDTGGTTVESIPIEEFPVLPGAQRVLQVLSQRPLGQTLPPGRYQVLTILDFGGANLLGGQLVLDIEPLALVPLNDAGNLPQDLDEDGFFEDVNGDGVFDDNDPILLGFQLNEPGVQENIRAFDFDNDGDVDFDDVLNLRQRLAEASEAG